MVHGQALSRAPVNTDAAADAAALVDHHCRRIGAELGPGHLRQLDIVVDRVDAIRRDHLNTAVRAGVDAAVAKDAAVAVDEDVELALEAALGFLETDRFGEADLDLEGRVV